MMFWQEGGQPLGSLEWLLAIFITLLVFQVLLGNTVHRTLRRPSWMRLVGLVLSLPFLAALYGIVFFSLGSLFYGL